jgi:hypothetical protein
MSAMHAVEVTDRYGASTGLLWKCRKLTDDVHNGGEQGARSEIQVCKPIAV